MTESTTAASPVRTAGRKSRRPAIPQPRRSPEDTSAPTPAPSPNPYEGYPLVRYALEHLTGLAPDQGTSAPTARSTSSSSL
jgi:hypothetical protein